MKIDGVKRTTVLSGMLTVLLRMVGGATFVFSGFVKGVDPQGTAMIIKEYFVGFGIYFLGPSSPL